MFTLLNGNPQSINLVAPLLADIEKHLDLVHLYRMLTSEVLYNELKKDNVDDCTLASLRISAAVSIRFISESDPETMNLFYLLGMMPGGITPNELDCLWKKIKECRSTTKTMEMKTISRRTLTNGEKTKVRSGEGLWRRALQELKKSNLVEELIQSKEDTSVPKKA